MQTFGNHEFDSGPALAAEFAANLTELGIPVLSCNLDVSQEPAFDGVELQARCCDGAVCRGSAVPVTNGAAATAVVAQCQA